MTGKAAHIVISTFEGDGPPGSRSVQVYVEDAAAKIPFIGVLFGTTPIEDFQKFNALCILQDLTELPGALAT